MATKENQQKREKMKLSVEKAKEITIECSKKVLDPEWFLLHSKLVVEMALILAGNKNVNKEILEIAGWIHDIGYSIETKEHAKYSIELLKDYELDEKLKDCILEHGSDGNPKTKEGEIIRIADKACIFNKDVISLIIKGGIKEKDINFLKKMSSKGLELLSNFKN